MEKFEENTIRYFLQSTHAVNIIVILYNTIQFISELKTKKIYYYQKYCQVGVLTVFISHTCFIDLKKSRVFSVSFTCDSTPSVLSGK